MTFLFTINPDHVKKQTPLMPADTAPHVVRQAYLARSVIGELQPGDIGKRVYSVRGVVQVENVEQRASREAVLTGRYRPHPEPPMHNMPAKRLCSERRESGERVCHCGLRWGHDEDRPECPHGGSY